jgi:hypothetical protein
MLIFERSRPWDVPVYRPGRREPRTPGLSYPSNQGQAQQRKGHRVAWSVKVTEEDAAWFTALIKDDLALQPRSRRR